LASPTFTYTVTTNWMAYQEAMVRIPVFLPAGPQMPSLSVPPGFEGYTILGPFFTGSVGVAESGTSVKGVSGGFSVTDNMVRTGITFTVGAGVPVVTLYNGTVIDLFTQYRGTQFISTVNIPGAVNIGSFTNEVTGGVVFRFTPAPSPNSFTFATHFGLGF
jgi:hypothetical protein